MEVTFTVNNEADTYSAEMCIPEGLRVEGAYEFIAFSVVVPFDEGSLIGAELVERQGDWHLLKLNRPYVSGDSRTLSFKGRGQITKHSGYPYGIYLQNEDARVDLMVRRNLNYDTEPQKALTSSRPHFIPVPDCCVSEYLLNAPSSIEVLSGNWHLSWFDRLKAQMGLAFSSKADAAALQLSATFMSDLETTFKVEINAQGIQVQYRDDSGFQSAQAFVFQYLLQWLEVGCLQACSIQGEPRYAYRGVHLDVVRHFFDLSDLYRWADLFALFQFNHFHWHLTDDDGWRLESKAFPELAETASWRGPDEQMPPQMGTGSKRYGGFYTLEEAKAFVARLDQLGMAVVPEMDLPGHARALLKSLPQLQEPEDESVYRSVQFHNDNVINPAYGQTLQIIGQLIDEWVEVFPGALFHIGCDEVPHGVWQKSPSALAWAEQHKCDVDGLNGLFTQSVEAQLNKAGKTLAGWEEVAPTGVSKNTWVYSWQGVEAGQKAALAGHPVVMTPAQSCYFDLATKSTPEDPGYWWAGSLDMEKVYQYRPEDGFEPEAATRIQGVQYCLWSELVDTPQKAEFMWFPRLLAGAQVVWKNNTNLKYAVFLESVDVWAQMLLRAGISVRSRKNGW